MKACEISFLRAAIKEEPQWRRGAEQAFVKKESFSIFKAAPESQRGKQSPDTGPLFQRGYVQQANVSVVHRFPEDT